ncbi:MAG: 16S rRNA (guanine(527)-N(7))-methyltransferase RsmG [Candidatus Binataceae bacterium]
MAAALPEKVGIFAKHLSRWGRKSNLTASPNDPAEILFHVMDSMAPVWIAAKQPQSALGRVFGGECRLMDIGSGAGFPGLILAAATGAETTLVESRRKRANFLDTAAAAMGLSNVTIVQTRVTSENVPTGFDLVTIRAISVSPEFFELASIALKPGGVAVAYLSGRQEFDGEAAAESSLVQLLSPHYDLSRGGVKVSRALGLWLKKS